MNEKFISHYKILKTIGRGSTSKVKLVEDINDQKKYAMKIVLPRDDIRTQISREVNILQKIASEGGHPNLVNLYDVINIENDDKLYLVIDYVDGCDLEEKIDNEGGALDEDESRFYFKQLINAIEFLHKKNITHRDLKLENLLISKSGNLKLADFGLSILAQTDLSTHCGTPYYVAPEVFFQKTYNGPPVDIWSCGVILYIMLSGNFPFEGRDFEDLGKKVLKGKINYPSYFSNEVVDLLKHILFKDPAHRFTIEEIKNHPWFKVSSEPLTPTEITAFDDLIIDLDDDSNEEDDDECSETLSTVNDSKYSAQSARSFLIESDNSNDYSDENQESDGVCQEEVQIANKQIPERLSSASSVESDNLELNQRNQLMVHSQSNQNFDASHHTNSFFFNKSHFDVYQIILNFLNRKKAKIYDNNNESKVKSHHKKCLKKVKKNHVSSNNEDKLEASIKFIFSSVKFSVDINPTSQNQTLVTVSRKKGSKHNFKRILKSMKSSFNYVL